MSHPLRRSSISASLLLAVLAGAAFAGPLTPPVGTVTTTGKTLTEIEPRTALSQANTPGNNTTVFRITQPGSYYLTANLSAVGKHGIEIAASGVTLDLSGFSVTGNGTTNNGVRIVDTLGDKVTIQNGTIENFGLTAVSLEPPNQQEQNSQILRNLRVVGTTADGISAGAGVTVEDCTVTGTVSGIKVGSGSIVRRCNVANASASGITLYSGSRAEDCVVTGCGTGMDLSSGVTVRSCTVGSSLGIGITSSDGVNIERCTITGSGTDGVFLGWGSRASGCFVNSNGRDGIVFGNYCTIEGNHLRANGIGSGITTGAALHAKPGSAYARIAGNFCAQGDRGLWIQGGAHTVVGNDAAANTINYVIEAGNRVGTIVLPAASVAISGSSGGGSGTTDSMANLAH